MAAARERRIIHDIVRNRRVVRHRQGLRIILPETGGDALRFKNSAIRWGRTDSPKANQRLSYELSTNADGKACAINLRTIARKFI